MTVRAPSRGRLREMAVLNAVVHLVGLVGLLGLRHGSPLVPLEERVAWLGTFPWPWALGWGAWMLAAVASLGFFLGLRWSLPDVHGLTAAAVAVGVGAALDLACETLHVSVLPLLARQESPAFVDLERALYLVGLVGANGAHAVGVLLATRALARAKRAGPGLVGLGAATVLLAAALALAGAADAARASAALAPAAVLVYVVWVLRIPGRVASDLDTRA